MKNFLRKNWLGLLAIVISVGTWLSFWLRFSPFTWDSFGVMAATMGIIVTFLVGFQIWTIIDNKAHNKMVSEQIIEIRENVFNEVENIKEAIKEDKKYLDNHNNSIEERLQFYEANFEGFERFIFGELYSLVKYINNNKADLNQYDEEFVFYRLKMILYLLKAKDFPLLKEVLINSLQVLVQRDIEIGRGNALIYYNHLSIWINNYGKEDEIRGFLETLRKLIIQNYQE